ncbi:hypothetical protein K470DRAFT_218798 [Piedraia hortae CBS 480.64]|uniref:Glycoside hydrolase family 23 protein n=1 Tax=Piedraia hortae CBS 480.64 TaxID=1314780 RepID=A0A6A7BXI3_9PEZI|nr:hypothetical protein K470DRAFT_218798 [Piedraia hortae CBS 480.64]
MPTAAPLPKPFSGYTVYKGDGTVAQGWPAQSSWVSSFSEAWNMNLARLKTSCASFNVPSNSPSELVALQAAILSSAASSGVDARFILAIVLQESGGCVRVPTTSYSVSNPGLMQSHEGSHSCNSGAQVTTPCPLDRLQGMITDGVQGTASSSVYSLQGGIAQAGSTDVSRFYKAARIYNSGSIPAGGDLTSTAGAATNCYSSDIANRLVGWTSEVSGCQA